jgi:hypothetical protein
MVKNQYVNHLLPLKFVINNVQKKKAEPNLTLPSFFKKLAKNLLILT